MRPGHKLPPCPDWLAGLTIEVAPWFPQCWTEKTDRLVLSGAEAWERIGSPSDPIYGRTAADMRRLIAPLRECLIGKTNGENTRTSIAGVFTSKTGAYRVINPD